MTRNHLFAILLVLAGFGSGMAQRPGMPGPPPGMPGQPGRPGGPPMDRKGPQGHHADWIKAVDKNNDGRLDRAELEVAIEETIRALDPEGTGTIRLMRPEGPRDGRQFEQRLGEGAPRNGRRPPLPPFFFEGSDADGPMDKVRFTEIARKAFATFDTNGDGVLDRSELEKVGPLGPRNPGRPEGPPPNVEFLAAELRFGDKLIAGKPFSAQIEILDTKRLFDGSIVEKKRTGALYRDSAGRTRREMPLEIGGLVAQGGDNRPQVLVFINDFNARARYFLDANAKTARKHPLESGGPQEITLPPGAQKESLGQREIEGVMCEGTRITIDIPFGDGGTKVKAVTETWFSPEFELIVLAKHTDPIIGEHVFRLLNISKAEPQADLFVVPAGYKIESRGDAPKGVKRD